MRTRGSDSRSTEETKKYQTQNHCIILLQINIF